jgi:hypothetical protein
VRVSPPEHRAVRRYALLLALSFLLLELALRHSALVEPDSVHMGYGIANAIRSGEGLAARDLYGRGVSFGYHLLFIHGFPLLGAPLSALPLHMNWLNMVSMAAAFVPLVLWMSRLWGRGVALAAAGLLAATPVLFELGGSGHPSGPAFLCLNTALLLYLAALGSGPRRRAVLLAGAAAVAFACAALRGTALLAFVLFPFLGLYAPRPAGEERRARRQAVAAGLAVGLVAALAFLVAQEAALAVAPAGRRGALEQLGAHLATPLDGRAILKGLAVWATGMGPLLLAAGWVGLAHAWRRHRAFAWAALALLVPSLVLWFPNPTPSRHFHLTYLVLAPAAVLWLRAWAGRRFGLAAVLLLALNIASMAAAYPLVLRHYRFSYVQILPRRTSTRVPLGDPATNRIWVRRRVALEERQASELALTAEPRVLVLGSAAALRLIFHVVSESPRYRLYYQVRHGAPMIDLATPGTSYAIYEYAGGPYPTPAALMRDIAAAGEFRDHIVAVIPVDRPVRDAPDVPPGYTGYQFAPLLGFW